MKGKKMLIPAIVIGIVASLLVVLAHNKGGDAATIIKQGTTSTLEIFPILLFALIGAATLDYIIPEDWIGKWIGQESGMKGIWIGTVAGIFCPPGGVVVLYGMVGGLLKAGAGIGAMVALITSYNLLALHRIPFEISMLGWKFLAIRILGVLMCAPIAGLIAQLIVKVWRVRFG